MSVNTASLTVANPITDANFRLMSQFIADVLQAGGFTKTADTGQVNLAAATFPGANNTYAGYEVRQFTDSLQATKPVFVKIQYGRGFNTFVFAITIQIGTGSDGAGNITGSILAATQINLSGNSLAAYNCYGSAGTARCGFAMFANAGSNANGGFAIERSKDIDGADNNKGVYVYYYNNNSGTPAYSFRYIPFTGPVPTAEVLGGALPPNNQTTGLHSDGNVAVYPCYFFGIGETLPPMRSFVIANSSDFTDGNTYTVEVLGVNQTMLKIPTSWPPGLSRSGGAAAAMLRYE